MNISYEYAMRQMEYSCNLIAERRRSMQRLMRRAIELGLLVVNSERGGVIFGRRITRVHSGNLQTRLERKNEGFPTMRTMYKTSSVKLYDKQEALRVETIMNSPDHFKVRRRLENFPELKDRMRKAAHSYMEVMAVAFDSHWDDKLFEKLSRPTQRGCQTIPGVKLDDGRLARVMGVILEMACGLNGFTLRQMYGKVVERYDLRPERYGYNQFRYDCRKLLAKGILRRIAKTYTYTVDSFGVRTCTIFVKIRTKLLEPLLSHPKAILPTPFKAEKAYRRVDASIEALMKVIGLKLAA